MSYILNIDTAIQSASVCLCFNDRPIATQYNPLAKDSAAWLQLAIKQLVEDENVQLSDIQAISVSSGPGSYTGLRVGMATAKGLCYVLKIPLITVNTLQMMASAVVHTDAELICPMIDARRMEVFTTVYNKELQEIAPYTNMVLEPGSFDPLLDQHSILFFGNGSEKFKRVANHHNARFATVETSASDLVRLSYNKFINSEFASLAYAEPFYGKDFHSIISNS